MLYHHAKGYEKLKKITCICTKKLRVKIWPKRICLADQTLTYIPFLMLVISHCSKAFGLMIVCLIRSSGILPNRQLSCWYSLTFILCLKEFFTCVCLSICTCVWKPAEIRNGRWAVELQIWVACRLTKVDAEKQAPVLNQSSKCPYRRRHLSNLNIMF